MGTFGGMVKDEQGFIDIAGVKEAKIYSYKGRTFVVTYDGEIYNQPELKSELTRRGNYFETEEDEEFILKAYTTWREECLEKFEGVFALGIWEVEERRLFLARDPIGAKSLFFSVLKSGIVFAGHVKDILNTREVSPQVTYEGMAELLCLGPSRRQTSAVFRNISQLESGTYLKYVNGSMKLVKYAELEAYENQESFEEVVDNIREMVIDSVLHQYRANGEIATLLSGGLDSSIVTTIVAEALKHDNRTLRTFSVDYEDNDLFFKSNSYQPNSDNDWIKKMVEFLDTDHRDVTLRSEDLADALKEAMLARGFPGMGDIDSSLLLFCKSMKKYADVGLGGECADEVFGGYPWFHREELKNADFFPWIRSVNERKEFVNKEIRANVNINELANSVYRVEINKVPKLYGESEENKRIREIGYLTYKWFLPVLLERQDKMAGKAGFHIRAPFCNFKLMNYVYNVPWAYRIHGDMEKGLLRYAFQDILPKEVAFRKKSPYPKTFNPTYREIMIRELKHILENPTSPLLDVVDCDRVEELIAEEESASRPWFGQLMRGPQVMAFFIQLNEWLKEYHVTIV
ncbi:MAG: asparagine synthase (glutamine-hydrolyzing) [Clostridia bacterium]|nr:asparagine synthase (glutamine-hydrolyzing) [Clostridia bacterium]